MKKHSIWNWLDGASLALLVFAMCGQISVRSFGRDTLKEGLGYASKTFSLDFSDVAFALVAVFFVLRIVQTRAWKRLWWPPLACWALIFALVISALHSPSIARGLGADGLGAKEAKAALAEIVQWVGYFLVAPWVFVNLIHDKRDGELISRRALAISALAVAALLNCAVGLAQLQTFTESAPQGLFSGPNVYCAFLAMVAPFLLEAESDEEPSAASKKLGPEQNFAFDDGFAQVAATRHGIGRAGGGGTFVFGRFFVGDSGVSYRHDRRRPRARWRHQSQGVALGFRGGVRHCRAGFVARAGQTGAVPRAFYEAGRK